MLLLDIEKISQKECYKMKNKLIPDFYFIILLFLTITTHLLIPIIRIIFFPYNLIGIILIFFGITLTIWANSQLILKQTSTRPYKIPSYFINSGPFKLSRNPIYLGMVLILLGIDVFLGTLVTFIFPMVFVIIMSKLFISLEEKNLENKFGNKYLFYKKHVRRWI